MTAPKKFHSPFLSNANFVQLGAMETPYVHETYPESFSLGYFWFLLSGKLAR